MGWVFNATRQPIYPRDRTGTIVQEAGWAPMPVWTGAENLAPTGIRSPDRPARSESRTKFAAVTRVVDGQFLRAKENWVKFLILQEATLKLILAIKEGQHLVPK